jgi:iron-sulfur cluster repair protein YtfE (RIC family)
MYAAHDAFNRDARRLRSVVREGRTTDPALRTGWETFKNQLHIHHTIEDTTLWPPLRQKVGEPGEVAVLDAMEAEHSLIDPLLARIDAAFASAAHAGLAESADELASALGAHMAHEEDEALPLVETYLGTQGWDAFRNEIRKTQGLKGAAEFLPWLLDDASADITKRVLGELPAPARLLYRTKWLPGYARTPRWSPATA